MSTHCSKNFPINDILVNFPSDFPVPIRKNILGNARLEEIQNSIVWYIAIDLGSVLKGGVPGETEICLTIANKNRNHIFLLNAVPVFSCVVIVAIKPNYFAKKASAFSE